MIKQNITLTVPNNEWLDDQVANNNHLSKSDIINEIITKARKQQEEIARVRSKLERAEKRGFSLLSQEEIKEKALSS